MLKIYTQLKHILDILYLYWFNKRCIWTVKILGTIQQCYSDDFAFCSIFCFLLMVFLNVLFTVVNGIERYIKYFISIQSRSVGFYLFQVQCFSMVLFLFLSKYDQYVLFKWNRFLLKSLVVSLKHYTILMTYSEYSLRLFDLTI